MEEGGSLIHTTGIFVERRNLDTDTHIERMPCKHELSDGEGHLQVKPQEARGGTEHVFPHSLRGNHTC